MGLSLRRTPGQPRSPTEVYADITFVTQEISELSLALVDFTVELYEALCHSGQYEVADRIRSTLVDRGINLTHGPNGVTWEKR